MLPPPGQEQPACGAEGVGAGHISDPRPHPSALSWALGFGSDHCSRRIVPRGQSPGSAAVAVSSSYRVLTVTPAQFRTFTCDFV